MANAAASIRNPVESVTKDWAKQRRAEERNSNAVFRRYERLTSSYRVTLRDAAFDVMEKAYLAASDNGSLPVKPRQIMYAARPHILRLTGQESLDDQYFSQSLLIDYMEEHDCGDWDIIWDARGHFCEPHTSREIALGTIEVRQYLGQRPSYKQITSAALSWPMFPTVGPQNRFRNIVFVEKEGFNQIFEAAQLQERLDIALMSTKGMSVTAARRLIDELTPYVDNIFVLHDFDRSGFSIFGTFGTDSRRYCFVNKPPLVDIGLRLDDVERMDLQSEPVPAVNNNEWRARAHTLWRHGATEEEIQFLRTHRVELNAMGSRQLIDFVEAKLSEHGVRKVIPDDTTIEEQAREVLRVMLTAEVMEKIEKDIEAKVAAAPLPKGLRRRLEADLKKNPASPWDIALARIVSRSR